MVGFIRRYQLLSAFENDSALNGFALNCSTFKGCKPWIKISGSDAGKRTRSVFT